MEPLQMQWLIILQAGLLIRQELTVLLLHQAAAAVIPVAAVVTPVVAVILAADTQYNFTRYDTCIKAATGRFYAYMWLRLKKPLWRIYFCRRGFLFCGLFHKYYDITPEVYRNRILCAASAMSS